MLLTLMAAGVLTATTPSASEPPACAAANVARRYMMKDDGYGPFRFTVMSTSTPVNDLRRRYSPSEAISMVAKMSADPRFGNEPQRLSQPIETQTIESMWAFAETDPSAVCTSFKPLARHLGVRFIVGHLIKRRLKPLPNRAFQARELYMLTPVLNRSGGEAMAYYHDWFGPLAGEAGFLVMRKNPAGDWRVVQRLALEGS